MTIPSNESKLEQNWPEFHVLKVKPLNISVRVIQSGSMKDLKSIQDANMNNASQQIVQMIMGRTIWGGTF